MQMLKHTGLGYLALLLAFAMHVAPDATADKVEGAGFAPSFDVASHVSAGADPLQLLHRIYMPCCCCMLYMALHPQSNT